MAKKDVQSSRCRSTGGSKSALVEASSSHRRHKIKEARELGHHRCCSRKASKGDLGAVERKKAREINFFSNRLEGMKEISLILVLRRSIFVKF